MHTLPRESRKFAAECLKEHRYAEELDLSQDPRDVEFGPHLGRVQIPGSFTVGGSLRAGQGTSIVVDGNLVVAGDLQVPDGAVSAAGDIKTLGSFIAESISAGKAIDCGGVMLIGKGGVEARGGSIKSQGDLVCGGDVVASESVFVDGLLAVTKNLHAIAGIVEAKENVIAGENISVGGRRLAALESEIAAGGTISVRAGCLFARTTISAGIAEAHPDDKAEIVCLTLESGRVTHGSLIERNPTRRITLGHWTKRSDIERAQRAAMEIKRDLHLKRC